MFSVSKKLIQLLSPKEVRIAALVLLANLFVAVIDVAGVASIMPFIAILSNQDLIFSNEILNYFYRLMNFSSTNDFLFFLGMCVFGILIFSTLARVAGFYLQVRFSSYRNHSIGERLFQSYMRQGYTWFLNRHSSDIATKLLNEVSRAVYEAMFPILNIISQGFVACFLLIMLLLVDPFITIVTASILFGVYIILYRLVNRKMKYYGDIVRSENHVRFRVVHETYGGIKDVKIKGLEDVFLKRFSNASRLMATNNITAKMLSQTPSFLMQGLIFGGLVFFLLYIMSKEGDLVSALPVVSLYAFAGYRLMPALQSIYQNLTSLRFAESCVDGLANDLKNLPNMDSELAMSGPDNLSSLTFEKTLELRDIKFSYDNTAMSLNGLSLVIEKNKVVGLVGGSGAGKTTTADILLGLLKPSSGHICVDGNPLHGNEDMQKLRNIMGYVPQQIFLIDNTVAANIAFGIPANEIDMNAVLDASAIANIHDFVEQELPDGYNTMIGEQGVRLSGGQRQRIGVARALYHKPDILVLDEATSALDNITERSVMDAVYNLNNKKTIIIIAHRLSTIKNCDEIFVLQNGKIHVKGSYNELCASSDLFREMTLEFDQ